MSKVFWSTDQDYNFWANEASDDDILEEFLAEEGIDEEDLKDNIALIVGNEGNGIDPELIRKSDVKIKIPMQGSIESLNASVAAAIIMYESVRK